MKKIIIKNDQIPNIKPNVSCIGYFDGIHLGHQQLINLTIAEAKRLDLIPTLICFEPDPIEIITKKKNTHLLSYKNRLNLIESFGIEQVIVFKFDKEFMEKSPKTFINKYLNNMNISEIICGYDFTFGYKGKGNIDDLLKNKKTKAIVVDEFRYKGSKVSTTRIKNAIYNGKFALTNKLLGWDYCLELIVNSCTKKDNKYVIEAKPLDSSTIIPKNGSYDDGFEIKESNIYITGNKKLNKGTKLYLSFSNYE